MTFNEASTVEKLVRDLLCGGVTHYTAVGPGLARRDNKLAGTGWHYLAQASVPRRPDDVLVEDLEAEDDLLEGAVAEDTELDDDLLEDDADDNVSLDDLADVAGDDEEV